MGQIFLRLLLHLWALNIVSSSVLTDLLQQVHFFDTELRSRTAQIFTMDSLVKAQNAFSWDMLKLASAKGGSKNVFFSPYSISSASSMVMAGAKGNTEEEMKKTFHMEKIGSNLDFLKLSKNLLDEVSPKSSETRFDVVNRIFVDNGTQLLDTYVSNMKSYFQSEVGTEEFSKAPEESRKNINSWVESKTEGKIENLFPSGSLSSATRLVLANAIYFKGQWGIPFDANDTHEAEFQLDSGDVVQCNMMFKNAKFPLHSDKDLGMNVVKLSYAGGEFDFIAAVPQSGGFIDFDEPEEGGNPDADIGPPPDLNVKLSDLESKISADVISTWLQKLQECSKGSVRDIDVFMPKFKVSFDIDLKQYLKELGINDLFSESADLSGMNGERNLFCGSAFHKAFIEVNEEGTEAAAATGFGMMLMCMPTQVKFDRPFLYFIVHRKSNAIVFSGKMLNPNL